MVGTLVPMPVDLRQGANVDNVPSTLRIIIVGTTVDSGTTVNGRLGAFIPSAAADSSSNYRTSFLTSRCIRIATITAQTSRIEVTPRECLSSCPYSASAQVWNGGSASAFLALPRSSSASTCSSFGIDAPPRGTAHSRVPSMRLTTALDLPASIPIHFRWVSTPSPPPACHPTRIISSLTRNRSGENARASHQV